MTVGVVMTKIVVKKFRKDLFSAGFIVNDEKSVWEPIHKKNLNTFEIYN
jgi:hypothetical protein